MRRGLGRSIIFLQDADNKQRYRDIVLSCCLCDIGYDVQSEGTKGRYLYYAIYALGDPGWFEGPVIDRFLSGRRVNRLDQQLTDLLVCLARDGSTVAVEALHVKYAQFAAKRRLRRRGLVNYDASAWEYLAIALLDIDGFAAFRRYATDVGQYMLRVPEGHDDPAYDWFLVFC